MKQPNWIKRAYKKTEINWVKSQAQIYKMLGDLGIYEIRFTNIKDRFALEFLVELKEDQKPRAVRMIIPIYDSEGDDKKREKELNRVHRILFHHLKAKFIAIQLGLTEFEEEFLAHLVIMDNRGNSKTIGENILPEYKKAIELGKGDIKLLE